MDEKIEHLAELARQDIGYTHAMAAFFKIGFHRGFAAREHEVTPLEAQLAKAKAALESIAKGTVSDPRQLGKWPWEIASETLSELEE